MQSNLQRKFVRHSRSDSIFGVVPSYKLITAFTITSGTPFIHIVYSIIFMEFYRKPFTDLQNTGIFYPYVDIFLQSSYDKQGIHCCFSGYNTEQHFIQFYYCLYSFSKTRVTIFIPCLSSFTPI